MAMNQKSLKHLQGYLENTVDQTDPDLEMQLLELWEEGASAVPSENLWNRISHSTGGKSRIGRRFRFFKYAAAAVVAVVMFAGGYYYASGKAGADNITNEKYVLITADGSVGNFTLPDGTNVWLNSRSKLEYGSDFSTNRIATLTGEGYFDVKHDARHPFRLEMDKIEVEVLGTKFDARCYPDGSYEDVVLRDGSVSVTTRQSDEVLATLKPNERLVYNPTDAQGIVSDANAENYCRWMHDRLVFSNMPLEDIIINLERKYQVEIEIKDNNLKYRHFSLTVSHEPLADVIGVISALTKRRARFESQNSIILE